MRGVTAWAVLCCLWAAVDGGSGGYDRLQPGSWRNCVAMGAVRAGPVRGLAGLVVLRGGGRKGKPKVVAPAPSCTALRDGECI